MGKHSHTLKTLRTIALDHGGSDQPDLACLARELGRVVHQHASTLTSFPRAFSADRQPFRCWTLAERAKPAISVVLVAWSPDHITAVQNHAGRWGLEMVLVGALEVQSFNRDDESSSLREARRDWLGPGDSFWFEGNPDLRHRSRNLSSRGTALSLHVYGGSAAQLLAEVPFETAPASNATSVPGPLAAQLR